MAFCCAASRSPAAWSRPSARSASSSDIEETSSGERGESRSEEIIVASEVVRLDAHVVGILASGDDGLGRLAEACGKTRLVDVTAYVASAEGARAERCGDPGGDIGLAVDRDEASELVELGAQI